MNAVERFEQIRKEHKYLWFIHQIKKEDGRNYTPDKENDCGWLSELVPIVYGEDGLFYCRAYTATELEPKGLLCENEEFKDFSVRCAVEDVFKGVYIANIILNIHINLLIDFDNKDSYNEFTYRQINKIIRTLAEEEQIDLNSILQQQKRNAIEYQI